MKKIIFVLLFVSVSVVGISFFIWKYPFRFPTMQLEAETVALIFEDSLGQLNIEGDGAYFQRQVDGVVEYRAFVPEPILKVQLKPGEYNIRISNISPAAVMQASGKGISEVKDNLTRYVLIKYAEQGPLKLQWRFPNANHYKFAAIGDTGENDELAWVIKRAHQLGVHFLLHLGDIYYDGNYQQAARILNDAPFPVYVALGNHDYLFEYGEPYQFFRRDLGPRNSAFSLGGVQFLNIDNAADTFPWSGGARGRLLRNAPMVDDNGQPFREVVAFMHRPIGLGSLSDHALNRPAEADWLTDQMLTRGVKSLLAGHIHQSFRHEYRGIKVFVAGEGLGTSNLVTGHPFAKILVGEIKQGQLTFSWQPLNMPLSVQCSLRNRWLWENDSHISPWNQKAMLTARKVCLSKENKLQHIDK